MKCSAEVPGKRPKNYNSSRHSIMDDTYSRIQLESTSVLSKGKEFFRSRRLFSES